jgi:hypothetical protein
VERSLRAGVRFSREGRKTVGGGLVFGSIRGGALVFRDQRLCPGLVGGARWRDLLIEHEVFAG